MDFNGLRLEYALEGISKYISSKDRMEEVLEDNDMKEFIDKDVLKPDVANLDAWQKKVEKERRILLDGAVRPHCLKNPCESHMIFNVEYFDGSIPKQQQP
jgi:hypothetical protein